MPLVPGLRSPYAKVGRVVYFGRMLDKIRLHAAGRLPADDYAANLGKGFDLRCVTFLRVSYEELKARTLAGGDTDEQLLAWAHARGGARTDEECEIWNGFMMKRGWRDDVSEWLTEQKQKCGFAGRNEIQTAFDFHDADEGRKPRFS